MEKGFAWSKWLTLFALCNAMGGHQALASFLIDFNEVGNPGSSPSVDVGTLSSVLYNPASFENQNSGQIELEITGLDVASDGGNLDTVVLVFEVTALNSGQTISDNGNNNGFGVYTNGRGRPINNSGEELSVSFLSGLSTISFGDAAPFEAGFNFLGFDEVVIRNPDTDTVLINGLLGVPDNSADLNGNVPFSLSSSAPSLTIGYAPAGTGGFRVRNFSGQVEVTAVPEPSTVLFGGFAMVLAWFGRRWRRRSRRS